MTTNSILPAPVAVAQSALDDLFARLDRIRWPERETVDGWQQGVPLDAMQNLCRYWRDSYDWRRLETTINGWNPQRTKIDGLGIHFLHVRSPEPDALPMILTHGWPGSVVEFLRVVGPLTAPRDYGGDPADAVHLVMPSLPGFGFSDKPERTGWGIDRIACAWIELMRRLGYAGRWAAQGGDWGGAVTLAIAAQNPPGCVGCHLNSIWLDVTEKERAAADAHEREILARKDRHQREFIGFAIEQATRPQTIGYALADSPVGQAAWIYEKFHDWTDVGETPEDVLSRDAMLDNITLYWLTGSGPSSARIYAESRADLGKIWPTTLPLGFSMFPQEMSRASERWARRRYPTISYWGQPSRGGHFAAFEQPDLFVDEVRAALRTFRMAART